MTDKPIDITDNPINVMLEIIDAPEQYRKSQYINELRDYLNEPVEYKMVDIEPNVVGVDFIDLPDDFEKRMKACEDERLCKLKEGS